MGYYANGVGSITFARGVTQEEQDKIGAALEAEWFEHDFFVPFHNGKHNGRSYMPVSFNFWIDDKYHSERVWAMLLEITDLVPVKEGCIEYVGEDGSYWRFIYKPETLSWHEQEGHIVYDED